MTQRDLKFKRMLKIILAEDHNIVRNGIKVLLEREDYIQIVTEATNGAEVLQALEDGKLADIVLADITMPGMDGITLTKELRARYPEISVIILSMLDNEKYVLQAFKEGAKGYMLKNVSAEELLFCIRHVYTGKQYICSELAIDFLNRLSFLPAFENQANLEFSIRELEILQLVAEGHTNTEMSDKLFISKRTVEGYRQNLIDKTGSKNTAALIRYALINGIIN